MVEKFNRTFLNMVRNNVSTDQKDWHKHIPLIMFSYRTSVNDTTGVTPSEALQGRKFNLPIDVLRPPILPFDSPDNDSSLDNLFNKMQVIRENVRSNADKAVAKRQKDYDNAKNRKISASFKEGDLVYWKKPVNKKGKCPKLNQIWQGPFRVKSKLSELNYVITDENNTLVTIHINNLKP